MVDVDTGALGPSGRFARMEAALDRIELKLDLKADMSALTHLESRVGVLEVSEVRRESALSIAKETVDNRFRVFAAAVGLSSAIATTISIFTLVTS